MIFVFINEINNFKKTKAIFTFNIYHWVLYEVFVALGSSAARAKYCETCSFTAAYIVSSFFFLLYILQ